MESGAFGIENIAIVIIIYLYVHTYIHWAVTTDQTVLSM